MLYQCIIQIQRDPQNMTFEDILRNHNIPLPQRQHQAASRTSLDPSSIGRPDQRHHTRPLSEHDTNIPHPRTSSGYFNTQSNFQQPFHSDPNRQSHFQQQFHSDPNRQSNQTDYVDGRQHNNRQSSENDPYNHTSNAHNFSYFGQDDPLLQDLLRMQPFDYTTINLRMTYWKSAACNHLFPNRRDTKADSEPLKNLKRLFSNKYNIAQNGIVQLRQTAIAMKSREATAADIEAMRENFQFHIDSVKETHEEMVIMERDINDHLALMHQFRTNCQQPRLADYETELDTKELLKCFEKCGTNTNPAKNFAQFYRKLRNFGERKQFSEKNYKDAMELLLNGELYDAYESVRHQSLQIISQTLIDGYSKDESLGGWKAQLKGFNRPVGEQLARTMARLAQLLKKTEVGSNN